MLRLHDDERGVSAVIVTIAIVVIVGFIALTVDGGQLFLKRRKMVNAADAAALAYAQWCAGIAGYASPDEAAIDLAIRNVANAEQDGAFEVTGECRSGGNGTVTVTFAGEQTLGFAPVIGVDSPQTVRARASAMWGGAGAAEGIMPFILSMGRLTNCTIPPEDPEARPTCTFWWNNKDIGNAQWSQVNLDQWNVSSSANCNSAGTSKTISWINGSAPVLSLNYPDPTYVCRDTGQVPPVFNELELHANETFAFPVNCPAAPCGDDTTGGQIDNGGNPAPPPASPNKYDIVGFAWLKILTVERGKGPSACGNLDDANEWCLQAEWEGYQTTGLDPSGGMNFGLPGVALIG